MREGKFLRIGGYLSGGVLIFLGIAVIALGIWGFAFTRDHIEREGITFGPIEDPAVAEHAEQWAGEPVDTGRKALAQAEIMREHTLSGTGGLTYAEMGRYQSAENPERSSWDERRGRGSEGRERRADLEQRPQHLGHGDRSRDRARHGIHVRDAFDLQHRRRLRAAVDRNRPGDSREGGVRTMEDRGAGRLFDSCARSSSRVAAAKKPRARLAR